MTLQFLLFGEAYEWRRVPQTNRKICASTIRLCDCLNNLRWNIKCSKYLKANYKWKRLDMDIAEHPKSVKIIEWLQLGMLTLIKMLLMWLNIKAPYYHITLIVMTSHLPLSARPRRKSKQSGLVTLPELLKFLPWTFWSLSTMLIKTKCSQPNST